MLTLKELSKTFEGSSSISGRSQFRALNGVSLTVDEGEFVCLLGPSGCGKTTLLRLIAGLELPTAGQIWFEGREITGVPPQKRPFHMVFQRYALFDHLNVFQNIAFPLQIRKEAAAKVQNRVYEVLDLVKLDPSKFSERSIDTLSGGQQQRVAIARALANAPRVLLLDEPLSALDQKLREEMREELRRLQRALKMTFIFVTHDQEEALEMADRVVVMNQGRLEQNGSPQEIYQTPETEFVAQFVGQVNQVLSTPSDPFYSRGAKIYIRPENIKEGDGQKNKLEVRIERAIYRGSLIEWQGQDFLGRNWRWIGSGSEGAALNREGKRVQISFSDEVLWSFK